MAGGVVLQMDQAASANQAFLRHLGERLRTQIWIAISVYVLVANIKKQLKLDSSSHTLLQILSLTLFEKLPLQRVVTETALAENDLVFHNQLNLFQF